MAKKGAFLFYPGTFLADTQSLTMEEKGKYIVLLCYMQEHGKMREAEMELIVNGLPDKVRLLFMADNKGNLRKKIKDKEMKKKEKDNTQKGLFDTVMQDKFVPPAIEELKICFMQRGLHEAEAEYEALKFLTHYTKTNWKTTRGAKVTDWKAAVTIWLMHKKEFTQHNKPHKTLTELWLE